jgi:lysozyme family protein
VADFAVSFSLMRQFEGGYVVDPDDEGGETCDGIARAHWASWDGWRLIDAWKAPGVPLVLTPAQYAQLEPLIVGFYRDRFWRELRGDDVAAQGVADELLEAAVLLGTYRAVRILQRALNLCNDRGRRWADLVVDGRMGPQSLAAIAAAERARRTHYVVTLQNVMQGALFVERMEARPINEKFIGWLRRVELRAARGA